MKQNILGVVYDNVTIDQALDLAESFLNGAQTSVVVTPNAEIAYEACRDPSVRETINQADLILPDGAGVILASKIVGHPLQEKVAGIDFATRLLPILAERGERLFLLGGKPGVAERAASNLRAQYPGLNVSGTLNGYFKELSEAIKSIQDASATVVFVCMGAPKQEAFMLKARSVLTDVRLMAGLGGSLDVFAGDVKRAPAWMIRLRLEWLYRLIREPKRFSRMLRIPKYLIYACRSKDKD